MNSTAPEPVSRFVTSSDGLRLHYREYGAPSPALPIVCLHGLARTGADFDVLARHLAQQGRRVIAIDYRGRGLSDRDPKWQNYNLFVENADILAVLDAAGVAAAIFVGTSRGGMHSMLLSSTRPEILRGVVLNDIGPVLEIGGLERIRGYVGKLPVPTSWAQAVEIAKSVMGAQFTGLGEAEWDAYARLTFEEKDGAFSTRYDANLMKPLAELDLAKPVPDMWAQFEGLRNVPVLAIRGENSDLLSPETLTEMAARHPAFEGYTVPGQGHAPLLLDEPTITRIASFISRIDPPNQTRL